MHRGGYVTVYKRKLHTMSDVQLATCLQHLAKLVHIARDEVQERQLIKLLHALIRHLDNLQRKEKV